MLMKKILSALLVAALVGLPTLLIPANVHADDTTTDQDRIKNAGQVLQEIMDIPDDIPQDVIDKADCVIVYPSVKKAAFIVGGSYGRGLITCRRGADFSGHWSAPAMFVITGGSWGAQIGGQAVDLVILIMNERGMNDLLSSKFKLGGNGSVAAGPVGRAHAGTGAFRLAARSVVS